MDDSSAAVSDWLQRGDARTGEKWSKDDFTGSLISPTGELFDLVGDGSGRRKSDKTVLHKLFPAV
jgi:hypothetical protein